MNQFVYRAHNLKIVVLNLIPVTNLTVDSLIIVYMIKTIINFFHYSFFLNLESILVFSSLQNLNNNNEIN